MRFLLDTNVLVFLLAAPEHLSLEAERIVSDERDLFVSIVSLWEIGIKQSLGKLKIPLAIPQIEAECTARDIRILPMQSAAIEKIKTLPDIHRDPFDRLLIAHALNDDMTIVTRDKIIPKYPVKSVG